MPRFRSALILALTALSLGACAKDAASYPSLARRPIERVSGTAPVAVPSQEAQAPADPAAQGKLDSLLAQARKADRAFQAQEARTRTLVGAASGAAVASEAWAVATVALSQLESARSDAVVAMAELDALYAQAVVSGMPAGDIASARNDVQAILTSQGAVIDALKGKLR